MIQCYVKMFKRTIQQRRLFDFLFPLPPKKNNNNIPYTYMDPKSMKYKLGQVVHMMTFKPNRMKFQIILKRRNQKTCARYLGVLIKDQLDKQ